MSRAVHVVAVAARTPVGLCATSTAAAIRARVSRLALHPFMVDAAGEPLRCARDALLDPRLMGPQRLQALASSAMHELFAQQSTRGTVPVRLALPEPRPGLPLYSAQAICASLTAQSYSGIGEATVQPAGEGHAGALKALADAHREISTGRSELCAVGGVDSYLDADSIDWLESQQLLARAGMRGGVAPGESAAFLLLASDGARRTLQLPSLARVVSVHHCIEQRSRDGEEGLLGEALSETILQTCSSLQLPQEAVCDVYCDINGERLRSDDWGFAVLRAQSALRDGSEYTTPVGEVGDIGAASGALGCVLAVRSFGRGYARGRHALVWAASWSGLRGACLLVEGDSDARGSSR